MNKLWSRGRHILYSISRREIWYQ